MSLPKPPLTVQEMVARGVPGGMDEPQIVALTRYWAQLLALKAPEANDMVVGMVGNLAQRSLANIVPPGTFACKKGCAHCCNFHVGLFAPEAFRIARQLRKTPKVRDALVDVAARIAGVAPGSRSQLRITCALLNNNACSIHAFRPHSCRAFMSMDVLACIAAVDGSNARFDRNQAYDLTEGRIGFAFLAALGAAGLFMRSYEINASLAMLLDDPGLEARWYAGEDVFAGLDDGLTRLDGMIAEPLEQLIWHARR
jgi:uncharacterized protein